MPAARPDRRVRRTRERLKTALLQLIEERGYDAVTVADVTERADVGRSTFYSHFGSLEELLFDGWDAWLLSLPHTATSAAESAPGKDAPRLRFSLPLLRHMRTQKAFIRAVLHGSDTRIRRKITEILAEVVSRELQRMSTTPAPAPRSDAGLRRKAQSQALAGAFLGVASWWLDEGARLSPEAVDDVLQGLIAPSTQRAP